MPSSRTSGVGAGVTCAIQLGCLNPGLPAGPEVCHVCTRTVHPECYKGHLGVQKLPAKVHCGTTETCCKTLVLPHKAVVTKNKTTEEVDRVRVVCAAASACVGGENRLEHLTQCCQSSCHVACISLCTIPACNGGGTAGPQGLTDDDYDEAGEDDEEQSGAEECGGGRSDGEEVLADDDSDSEVSDEAQALSDGDALDDNPEGPEDDCELISHDTGGGRPDEGTPTPDGTGEIPDHRSGNHRSGNSATHTARGGERRQSRTSGPGSSRHMKAGASVGLPSPKPATTPGSRGRPGRSTNTQQLGRSQSTDYKGAGPKRVVGASVGAGSSSAKGKRTLVVSNPYGSILKPRASTLGSATTRSTSASSCPPRSTSAKDDVKQFNLLRESTSEALHEACQTREFADQVSSSIFKSPFLAKQLEDIVKKSVVGENNRARASFMKGLKNDVIQVVKGSLKPMADTMQENVKGVKKLVEGCQKSLEGTQKTVDSSSKSMVATTKKMTEVCGKITKMKTGDAHVKTITANVVEGVDAAISKVFPAVKSGCASIKDGLLEALLPATGGAREVQTPPSKTHRRRSTKKVGSRDVDSEDGRTPTKERSRARTPESTKLKRKHKEEIEALRRDRRSSRESSTPPRRGKRAAARGEPTQRGHERGAATGGSSEGGSGSNPAGHAHHHHAQGATHWDTGTAPGSGQWSSGAAPESASWNHHHAQVSGGWGPGAGSGSGHWAAGAASDFGNDQGSPFWHPGGDSSGKHARGY